MGRTNPDQRIPVALLTGFLDSGKTTVLNYLVQQPELHERRTTPFPPADPPRYLV